MLVEAGPWEDIGIHGAAERRISRPLIARR